MPVTRRELLVGTAAVAAVGVPKVPDDRARRIQALYARLLQDTAAACGYSVTLQKHGVAFEAAEVDPELFAAAFDQGHLTFLSNGKAVNILSDADQFVVEFRRQMERAVADGALAALT